ncbi:MAG: glucose-6-phosphate dehydrogenase [Patescibacteria group bacterium]|nr:glucose-6-phosphate dehydrogenase [Patescibacteria group bacterium]
MDINNKNAPTILIVLGATGDLMARKIVPSLFHLFDHNNLPQRFKVVGFARRSLTDTDFQEHVHQNLIEHSLPKDNQPPTAEFLKIFSYFQGNFEDVSAYQNLAKALDKIDAEWGVCANKLFYLAVPPEQFEIIFTNLKLSGLNVPCSPQTGWTRMLIEKPFGRDLKTAERMLDQVSKFFKDEQVYLIDHYLAKEILQGIVPFRFSNNLLEDSWDNTAIEKIEIKLLEKLGAEKRGKFYDNVGALRDVGQNHLLEMLAVLTMEYPEDMDPYDLRHKRAAIIEKLKPWTKTEIIENTFRAQYDSYQQIVGVDSNSQVETYFKLKTELIDKRWRGVPIFLESGKGFESSIKQIKVTFRHPDVCFLCVGGDDYKNTVTFSLEPESRITIDFWTKKPGYETTLEKRSFTFVLYENKTEVQYVEEYSKLILGCILGDQTLFVSPQEIRAMWKFADPINEAWQQNLVPLNKYQLGSNKVPGSENIKFEEITQTADRLLKHEVAIIGLGKMGGNLARRLIRKKWKTVVYNRTSEVTKNFESFGGIGAYSTKEIVEKLIPPRVVWLMLPAGQPTDDMLFGPDGLVKYLAKGDIIIDGANSYFKDSIKRAEKLNKVGIKFLDVGVSGGPAGALNGACLMIGGERHNFELLEPLFYDIALPNGYQFFDGVGAGHFVKMVHNGIEYGMMQAIGEGFGIMKKTKYDLDLSRVTDIYNHGSVIESRLIGWLKSAFELHTENLNDVSGSVGYTGEGEWTAKTAKELKIKAKIIDESVKFRQASKRQPSYIGQVVSALREQFGGHKV